MGVVCHAVKKQHFRSVSGSFLSIGQTGKCKLRSTELQTYKPLKACERIAARAQAQAQSRANAQADERAKMQTSTQDRLKS